MADHDASNILKQTKLTAQKPRSKDLIDYTYNDLCFILDNFFGKPPKSELGKLIKENSGFDAYMNNSELGQVVKPLFDVEQT